MPADPIQDEIEHRNALRAEHKLPRLDPALEYERLIRQKAREERLAFYARPDVVALRARIAAKVLADIRRTRGADWRPTGPLNGGYELGLKTEARLKKVLARLFG